MANTYCQIYIHITFPVKGRMNLIQKEWKTELYKYIFGIVNNKKQKVIAINGVENHIHILLMIKRDVMISDVVRDIKANSTRFINEKNWVTGKFEWQVGFGAFSVGHTQLDVVVQYIHNQEEHHRLKTFREEYLEFLREHEVEFKPEYLFEEV